MNLQTNIPNSPLETLHVNSKKIFCDGEKESVKSGLGHPAIYLDMGKNDSVVCPYCSRSFTIKKRPITINKNKNG